MAIKKLYKKYLVVSRSHHTRHSDKSTFKVSVCKCLSVRCVSFLMVVILVSLISTGFAGVPVRKVDVGSFA